MDNLEIEITKRTWCDIQMLGIRALSPLKGFLGQKDYKSCIENMHLEDGTLWSIPITLPITQEIKDTIQKRRLDRIDLKFENRIWGQVEIEEIYKPDKEKESISIYKTKSEEHPGVKYLKQTGDFYVAGRVKTIEISDFGFRENFLTPDQTRQIFKEKNLKSIVGFQTRNPPHRAHEYIQKIALEICDALFINPIVGETKSGDIPPDVIMKSYSIVIDAYYTKDKTFLVILPASMRYAGPKEAVHHAIIRRNYGCSHFIIGRDHAGVGKFYGPFDAHKIFENIDIKELGITPLFFDTAFYCTSCKNMASPKTCPHNESERLSISGTQLREMLKKGKMPPEEFMRKEVSQILINYYKNINRSLTEQDNITPKN